MLSILIPTKPTEELRVSPENCTSINVALEEIIQVGSHFVDDVIMVVALVF